MSQKDRNYNAYQYFLGVSDEFNLICQPLDDYFNIKHFGYLKIFPNGSYLAISNDKRWQKFYYESVDENAIVFDGETRIKALKRESDLLPVLWPKYPTSKLLQHIYEHGLWNGFYFTRASPDCTEFWTFSCPGVEQVSNIFYIKNCDALKGFVNYFNKRAQNLLKDGMRQHNRGSYLKLHYPSLLD